MHLPSRRRLKKELNRKLIYYPLLRMLLFKAWFRVAFLFCCAIGLIGSLYLPRMWKSSPADFFPVVKVSALDMTQAWALKRSAQKAAESGDRASANLSWQTAIANNPADAEAVRGFLHNLLKMEKPDKRSTSIGIAQTLWLLRLTGTNSADVELSAQAYDHFRFYDVALYVLTPLEEKLPPKAQPPYLKALFHQGKFSQFGETIRKFGPNLLIDQDLKLYQLAFQAGWSDQGSSAEALEALGQARENRETKVLANRLYMMVASKRGDVAAYGESLGELEKWNQASVADHTGYWTVLARAGQKEQARELALAFTRSPGSGMESVRLAEIYHSLGLKEQSRDVLKRFAPQFGYSPEVWLSYASLLEDDEDWMELRGLALQIRKLDQIRDTLEAYTYYLEGRAELGHGRMATAEAAFRTAASGKFEYPGLALLVARNLLKFNYPIFAKQLLLPLEESYKGRSDYWESCFEAAHKLKDSEWLLKAATITYQEKPGDPALLNRLAASLIVNRARPEEAVRQTLQLIAAYPNSLAAVVNHSLALLLNRRTAEAAEQLERVNPEALSPSEAAAYYLALFDLHLQRGELTQAAEAAAKIQRSHLFPPQVAWLEEKVKTLPLPGGKA